jgi:hypothetical protein
MIRASFGIPVEQEGLAGDLEEEKGNEHPIYGIHCNTCSHVAGR